MGPETPLTRIREIMAGRLSMYQPAKRPNKLGKHSKVLKPVKCRKVSQQNSQVSQSARDMGHPDFAGVGERQRAAAPAPHRRCTL